jgi:hypothetical protein
MSLVFQNLGEVKKKNEKLKQTIHSDQFHNQYGSRTKAPQ